MLTGLKIFKALMLPYVDQFSSDMKSRTG